MYLERMVELANWPDGGMVNLPLSKTEFVRIEHAAIRPVRQFNHSLQVHFTAYSKTAHSGQPRAEKIEHAVSRPSDQLNQHPRYIKQRTARQLTADNRGKGNRRTPTHAILSPRFFSGEGFYGSLRYLQ
jgi:hypothetical protein